MIRLGKTRLGKTWLGMTRLGKRKTRLGKTRLGKTRLSKTRLGKVYPQIYVRDAGGFRYYFPRNHVVFTVNAVPVTTGAVRAERERERESPLGRIIVQNDPTPDRPRPAPALSVVVARKIYIYSIYARFILLSPQAQRIWYSVMKF